MDALPSEPTSDLHTPKASSSDAPQEPAAEAPTRPAEPNVPAPIPRPSPLSGALWFLVGGLGVLVFVLSALLVWSWLKPAPSSALAMKPTPELLVAIHDVAKLETTELHMEKVIDLTDRQSTFFGLVEANDAILLVASGDIVLGVDLSKVGESDVTFDPETRTARIRLPSPEVLSTRLDEKGTYVYTRSTDLLARRNEQLETRARQEAVAALERAARESDVAARAKQQAERQLRALVTRLGAERVDFDWH